MWLAARHKQTWCVPGEQKKGEFISETRGSRENPGIATLSSPGESSGSLFAWLVGFVVVILV